MIILLVIVLFWIVFRCVFLFRSLHLLLYVFSFFVLTFYKLVNNILHLEIVKIFVISH